VRLKHSFLFPKSGARRQLDLFLPGAWSDPVPIHCWAVEHGGRLLLIDTGETAAARNIPFARFDVAPAQELAGRARGGWAAGRRRRGGRPDPPSRRPRRRDRPRHGAGGACNACRCSPYLAEPLSRVMRRVLRQPLPPGFAPVPFRARRRPVRSFRAQPCAVGGRTDRRSGRPRATRPEHVSVICIDDDGRHVMPGRRRHGPRSSSSTTRRADAVAPDPEVHRATLARIPRALRRAPDRLPALAL